MDAEERHNFEAWRAMLHQNWKNSAEPEYALARMMFIPPDWAKEKILDVQEDNK